LIELRALTKRYAETLAVDALSLTVRDGELLVLLGASGCGKTTTLKMVNRLVEPTDGTVLVGGNETRALEPHVLRRRIGYAFQRVGLFPHMTVAENVGITPELLGWDRAEIDARVRELLALVELDPDAYVDRFPGALSGGQAQRVGVARALAAKPEVLLLDEPFGALDPLTRTRLRTWLARVQRSLGVTTIFVTHDMTEALLLGDRIAVMDAGRLVQVGTPRELVHAPATALVAELIGSPAREAERVEALLAGDDRDA